VIQEALKAGAKAYILKSDGAKGLIVAIEALQQNRTYFNSRIGQIVLNGFLNTGKMPPKRASILPDLTAREREVVQLLAEGKSTKEVAITLGVSVKTAETHRSKLMRKLGLHCLVEVVLYAVRNNIVQVPGEHGYPRSGPSGIVAA
jgi:DNA-binding NarL/FixJ family response regulator